MDHASDTISLYLNYLSKCNQLEDTTTTTSSMNDNLSIVEIRKVMRTAINNVIVIKPNLQEEEEEKSKAIMHNNIDEKDYDTMIRNLLDIISFHPTATLDCCSSSNACYCDPKIGLYSIRLLSNMITKNKERSSIALSYLKEKDINYYSQMMHGFSNNCKNMSSSYSLFIEAMCTLLYNSCMALSSNSNDINDNDLVSSFCSSLLQDKQFMIMLLLSDDDENENNKMSTFLLCKLISIGLFPSLYDSIADHYQHDDYNDDNETLSCLNNQLKLLEIFLIERHISNNDDDNCSLLLQSVMNDELRRNTLSYLIENIFLNNKDSISDGINNSTNDAIKTQNNEKKNKKKETINDIIIEILANYFQTDETKNAAKVNDDRTHIANYHKSFFQNIVCDLHVILYPFILQKEMEVKGLVKSDKKSVSDDIRLRVLSMIRLIGNLCYKCHAHQNLLREEISTNNNSNDDNNRMITGLHLLLSSTSLPFVIGVGVQEWCIIAIRYAMEDNIDNQDFVHNLQQIS